MDHQIAKQVEQVAKRVEEQIDSELDRLNNLEIDDLSSLRQKRLQEMKLRSKKQMEWKANGHGEYSALYDQKAFFDACKSSERVIVHFYRNSSPRCEIFDMHLKVLCEKHIETRFCKIDAEKSPFLCDRLAIKVLPVLLLLKDAIAIGRLTGFSELDNRDDFSNDLLEWVLGNYDMVDYPGDKETRPTGKNSLAIKDILKANAKKKTIRGKLDEDSGSDLE